MKSLILTSSYLWKDTWKRWFEQPGSLLARVVVTTIMVSISVILLVAFAIQVAKVKKQIEAIGLNKVLFTESISATHPYMNEKRERLRDLEQFGDLVALRQLGPTAWDHQNRPITIFSYTERDLLSLSDYLEDGYDTVLLSNKYPQGLLLECRLANEQIKCVTYKPKPDIARLLQQDTLLIPSLKVKEIEKFGYTIFYYLKKSPEAQPLEHIIEGVNNLIRYDRYGRVSTTSAVSIKKRLEKLESQQKIMRFSLAAILGAAIALIYGTLSVLEFRQSMYIAALLRSFGTSRFLLGVRTVLENLLIANLTAYGVVYLVSRYHNTVFKTLRLQTEQTDLQSLYWNTETLWLFAFINLGVIISSLPVFLAMRKPVGKILS